MAEPGKGGEPGDPSAEGGVPGVGSTMFAAWKMLSNVQVPLCAPPLASVKVAVKLTAVLTAKSAPLAGPVSVTTGSGFTTVTTAVQVLDAPWLSVTVRVTAVWPGG